MFNDEISYLHVNEQFTGINICIIILKSSSFYEKEAKLQAFSESRQQAPRAPFQGSAHALLSELWDSERLLNKGACVSLCTGSRRAGAGPRPPFV